MLSVFVLGCCVLLRSYECNFLDSYKDKRHTEKWYNYIQFTPTSWKHFLDAIPLFISCFVCHYNIPTVHNELQNPTSKRTSWWLRSTAWSAALFYLVLGFGGSMYGNCTASGTVQGNVLLDFEEDDPLLMVGRMCLALTITLAFPMLVIPARDIVWKSIQNIKWSASFMFGGTHDEEEALEEPVVATARLPSNWADVATTSNRNLEEPLLSQNQTEEGDDDPQEEETDSTTNNNTDQGTFLQRLVVSMTIFWSAAAVACCVSSIDVVWDLLGSSLSILLSYLIPCGAYLVLSKQREHDLSWDFEPNDTVQKRHYSRLLCWAIVSITAPLMIVSTGNAIVSTFFS